MSKPELPVEFEKTIILSSEKMDALEKKWRNAPSDELMGISVLKSIDSTVIVSGEVEDDTSELMGSIVAGKPEYAIERKFAEGGFGLIFRAEDKTLKRRVAIKQLRDKFRNDPKHVRKFVREARLTAQLDHPSIVPVYQLRADDEENLQLAMKYINGITLRDFITRLQAKYNMGKISAASERKALRSRLEYFLKICDCIEFAHSRGIIHGDLKPGNIMIGTHGEIYVMDWGSAVKIGEEHKSGIAGTLVYVAPEVYASRHSSLPGDIFALGLILYELVGLRAPYGEGHTSTELRARVRDGQVSGLTHYREHLKIPVGIRAVVEKAIAVKPRDRYASVSELRSDVHNYIFNEEVAARPDKFLTRIGRYMVNHRSFTVGLIAGVLLLLSFLTAWGFHRKNQVERDLSLKLQQRLQLQQETDSRALGIDQLLISILSEIKSFSLITAQELSGPVRQTEKVPKIYFNRDYERLETAPPDLAFSPAYDQMISLTHMVVTAAVGTSETELAELTERMQLVKRLAYSMLISRTTREEKSIDLLDSFRENGGQVRKLVIYLPGGISATYPGMYQHFDVENAGKQWSRAAEYVGESTGYWGTPYAGRNGIQLLSYWDHLYDSYGAELGFFGIEIDFGRILNIIKHQSAATPKTSFYYLVNSQNQIIATNDPALAVPLVTGATPDQHALPKFRFSSYLHELRESSLRQVELTLEDKEYILSYCPVKSLNWNFFQLVSKRELDNSAIIRERLKDHLF